MKINVIGLTEPEENYEDSFLSTKIERRLIILNNIVGNKFYYPQIASMVSPAGTMFTKDALYLPRIISKELNIIMIYEE